MEFVIPAIVVLVIAIVAMGAKTVPQGSAYIVERLGRYHRTLSPGFSVIIPVIDTVRAKVSTQEVVLAIPRLSVVTKDNVGVTADCVLYLQVIEPQAATYEVSDYVQATETLAMTSLRTAMGSMELDELLSNREKINASLLKNLEPATAPWGIKVTRVEIAEISPPSEIVEAMSRQMRAERDRRAQVLAAEAERESQIRLAQGRLEAAKLDAEARERLAEAEAKATKMVNEAIAGGDAKAVNYFLGQKYVEALAEIGKAPNSKIVLMPVELSALGGTLAGLQELSKSLDGKN